jgi:hypothetical protein
MAIFANITLFNNLNCLRFFLRKTKGTITKKAVPYLRAAKLSGEMLSKPNFIMTQEDDQRSVTKKAVNTDTKCNFINFHPMG